LREPPDKQRSDESCTAGNDKVHGLFTPQYTIDRVKDDIEFKRFCQHIFDPFAEQFGFVGGIEEAGRDDHFNIRIFFFHLQE
jgi:hypothetical protein